MSGSVWAWFMESWPPRVGREDKTVWRIEGPEQQAQPTFTLRGPGGAVGRLDWGPQEHGASTWNRPGREFGTGLFFPSPGCWDAHVELGRTIGDVFVVVVD